MKEIIQFSKCSKFSKMITSLLLGLRHDSEDLSVLKDLFHKIDVNNDGSISRKEFEKAADELHDSSFFNFKDLKWDEIFKEIDLDGDGRIDFHEFCVAAVDHKKLLSTQNLKYVFQTLDMDDSGTIELDEFKGSLPSTFKRCTVSSNQILRAAKVDTPASFNSILVRNGFQSANDC